MKRLLISLTAALFVAAAVGASSVHLRARSDRASSSHRSTAAGADALAVPRAMLGAFPRQAEHGEESPEGRSDYLDAKYSSTKRVTLGQVRRAFAQAAAMPVDPVGGWEMVGPSNVGARITDLVVDPTQADTMYVAVASGGVWKSTDAGSSC